MKKKICIPVGDYLQFAGSVAICKEVSPNGDHCSGCVFCTSDNCDIIACCTDERPDGKNVIFVEERGME